MGGVPGQLCRDFSPASGGELRALPDDSRMRLQPSPGRLAGLFLPPGGGGAFRVWGVNRFGPVRYPTFWGAQQAIEAVFCRHFGVRH